MRPGIGAQLLHDADGNLAGLSCGRSDCPDHGAGIAPICKALGVGLDTVAIGLDARRITGIHSKKMLPTRVDLGVKRRTAGDDEHLVTVIGLLPAGAVTTERFVQLVCPTSDLGRACKATVTQVGGYTYELEMRVDLSPRGPRLAATWDSEEFAIVLRGQDGRAAADQLWSAWLQCDLVIECAMQSALWPLGTGLVLTIASRAPAAAAKELLYEDIDRQVLRQAMAATGIEDRLRKAGCTYHELEPQWTNGPDSDLVYWLVPKSKRVATAWYSLSDLEEWASKTA